jgi:hypothetical protein
MVDHLQFGGGDAASPETSPLRVICGSCVNTTPMQQQSIISMEEDEMSDQEVVSIHLCYEHCYANLSTNKTMIDKCLHRAVIIRFEIQYLRNVLNKI